MIQILQAIKYNIDLDIVSKPGLFKYFKISDVETLSSKLQSHRAPHYLLIVRSCPCFSDLDHATSVYCLEIQIIEYILLLGLNYEVCRNDKINKLFTS